MSMVVTCKSAHGYLAEHLVGFLGLRPADATHVCHHNRGVDRVHSDLVWSQLQSHGTGDGV